MQWPVYGHEWAVRLLQRTLETAGPHHAYLFLGPPQVGKGTLVRSFVQTLLCMHPARRPCGECRACKLVEQGSHPDLHWIQPVDRDGNIDRANGALRVEQAAAIIHEAALRPMEARYRVFVIQDFHAGNASFANKLLKTLEEPPDHVVLCLTAHDRSGLLSTIVSRCQVIELRPAPAEVVENALVTTWQAAPAQAALLARLANGRLGWAVQQLGEESEAGLRRRQLEQLWQLVAANRVSRLDTAEKMATARNNQQLFAMLALWTTWWRDVLLVQVGCQDAISNIDQEAALVHYAAVLPQTAVRDYLYTLQRIEEYLHHTVNTRLALDVLFLQLPHIAHA